MEGEVKNACITCFDHGILRESRLFPIDPIVGEKTNGHQCRRSIGADRRRDHKCLMMKITHPCAFNAPQLEDCDSLIETIR